MPTADRTTIKAVIEDLTTKLRANIVADPPTDSRPFRKMEIAAAGVEEYPRPFLTLQLIRSRVVGVTDNDKLLEVTMSFRLVTDVSALDPHAAILDKIGAVEDYFDSLIDIGVLDGSEGFDNRIWKIDYPKTTSGSRVGVALAEQSFVVKVERQQNREPAV